MKEIDHRIRYRWGRVGNELVAHAWYGQGIWAKTLCDVGVPVRPGQVHLDQLYACQRCEACEAKAADELEIEPTPMSTRPCSYTEWQEGAEWAGQDAEEGRP
jgi:hypothetical protein